jgi:threonine/homoserine/homoserine lactone efflux protein
VKRPPADPPTAGAGRSPWHGFRWGLLTNLLNPKIGVFYVAVLPPFLPDAAAPAVLTGMALATVHVGLSLVWFSVLILGASRLRPLLERPRAQRSMDAVTGSVVMGFGVRLALWR